MRGIFLFGALLGLANASARAELCEPKVANAHWRRLKASQPGVSSVALLRMRQDLVQNWTSARLSFAKLRKKFSAHARPADAGDPTGDFYHVETLPDGNLLIMMGDVASHGERAATDSMILQSTMNRSSMRPIVDGGEPGKILENLNNKFIDRKRKSMFATMHALNYDPRTGKVRVADAGSPPMIIVHADNTITVVDAGAADDFPLGLLENNPYATLEFTLRPGDILVTASDGLMEGHMKSQPGEEFQHWLRMQRPPGSGRLQRIPKPEFLRNARTPDEVERALFSFIDPTHDDVTGYAFQH